MKRWVSGQGREVESARIDAFLDEVIAVCNRHGLSIGHEDSYGSFIVEADEDVEWLRSASVTSEALKRAGDEA